MKKLLFGLFSFLFFTSTIAINISNYRFHTMPETSYYGGIHSITKDSIGRVWFSGYDALFVYDGNSYTSMNDLATHFFPRSYWSYGQVITDSTKKLYVCTNHGLLKFNYQKKDFELVLKGNIGSATSGDDGTIWLVRNGRIESFNPAKIPHVVYYPLPSDIVISNIIYFNKQLYVASTGKLYKLNTRTKRYSLFSTIGDESHVIKDVLEYNGLIYILTHMNGLYECNQHGKILKHYNLLHKYDKSASAKKLYLDSSNIIWVATQSGLFLLNPLTGEMDLLRFNIFEIFSLPNNSVWSIYPDSDGGVWIGTYGGKLAYMTFFDNNVNYYKSTSGGLNHPIVSCFEEDRSGNLCSSTRMEALPVPYSQFMDRNRRWWIELLE